MQTDADPDQALAQCRQRCICMPLSTFRMSVINMGQYTLEILKSMAGGNAIDVQREERWPRKLDGLQVKFQSWEEKTDSSDDGTYPPGTTFDKGEDGKDDDDDGFL